MKDGTLDRYICTERELLQSDSSSFICHPPKFHVEILWESMPVTTFETRRLLSFVKVTLTNEVSSRTRFIDSKQEGKFTTTTTTAVHFIFISRFCSTINLFITLIYVPRSPREIQSSNCCLFSKPDYHYDRRQKCSCETGTTASEEIKISRKTQLIRYLQVAMQLHVKSSKRLHVCQCEATGLC